jgi:hypothetical protein
MNIQKMTDQEINKELSFLQGYLFYMKYENPLFKQYQNTFETLQNERKARNLLKYQQIKNRGF